MSGSVKAGSSSSSSTLITATRSHRLLEELRASTLESRLEELGVLRSFSRPRVSNDNPYSESLFRTVKCRPDYPRKPFGSKSKPVSGLPHSSTSTNIDTGSAGSNLCHLFSDIADRPLPFVNSVPMSTRKPGERMQHAAAETSSAEIKQKRCGSTSHSSNQIK